MREIFTNLKVEMVKLDIKQKHLAKLLNISVQAMNYKMTGKVEFRLEEMKIIRDHYFKGLTLDYLFKK